MRYVVSIYDHFEDSLTATVVEAVGWWDALHQVSSDRASWVPKNVSLLVAQEHAVDQDWRFEVTEINDENS